MQNIHGAPRAHLLFICSRNRLRSPTGEALYASHPRALAMSAGTAPDAEERVDAEAIEWADVVFAMEARHRKALSKMFPRQTRGKRVIVLGIPDEYEFMDPELQRVIRMRVDSHMGWEGVGAPGDSHPELKGHP